MNKQKHHFFAFVSRMKYISRWGLMRNTRQETLQEHSLDVSVITHALAIIGNSYFGKNYNAERAAVLGMYHDCDETITGDLPTPIKYYNPAIKDAYKRVEDIARNRLISMLPEEIQPVYSDILFHNASDEALWKLVKAADRISAYIKCVDEIKAGNSEFKKAAEATFNSIKENTMPEVDFFLQHFLPSYQLTLDELD